MKAAENGSRPAQVRVVFLALELGKTEMFEKWFESALILGVPGQNGQLGVDLTKKRQQAAALRAFEYEFENGNKNWAEYYRQALMRSGKLEEAERVRSFIEREAR